MLDGFIVNDGRELCPVEVLDPRRSSFSEPFHLALHGYVDLRPFDQQIRLFVEAVKRRYHIRIRYLKPTAEPVRVYEAEPYGVLLYREALYGVVIEVPQRRTRMLPYQRMEHIKLLPQITFQRDPHFSLSGLLDSKMGIVGGGATKK